MLEHERELEKGREGGRDNEVYLEKREKREIVPNWVNQRERERKYV